ncbi:MAG: sigma-70 family RNA polymerase sigma factor [Acidobacteria bacterium]|nr:sigma-70 family RNA polymerase sigma factor [Acidobacteriota bacterium]
MTPTEQQAPPSGEEILVQNAKSGDVRAFTELVNRYNRRIFRLARHITQNQEDAEDVLQEVFLKAYTHLHTFEGNARFYTWLVRIAVNESLMKLRKRKTDKEISLDEPVSAGEDEVTREIAVWDGSPEARFSQTEIRRILDDAVDTLAPIYRTVFLLRDVDELSTEDTAETLGLSIPAVKSRLLRARLQLREKLTRVFKKKEEDLLAYL